MVAVARRLINLASTASTAVRSGLSRASQSGTGTGRVAANQPELLRDRWFAGAASRLGRDNRTRCAGVAPPLGYLSFRRHEPPAASGRLEQEFPPARSAGVPDNRQRNPCSGCSRMIVTAREGLQGRGVACIPQAGASSSLASVGPSPGRCHRSPAGRHPQRSLRGLLGPTRCCRMAAPPLKMLCPALMAIRPTQP